MDNKVKGSYLLINKYSVELANRYKKSIKVSSDFYLYFTPGPNLTVNNYLEGEIIELSPLLVKINILTNGIELTLSQLAIGDVYYLERENGIEALSSEPAILAALFDCELSINAIYQDISIGFRLGNLSIYENIFKLNANHSINAISNKITLVEHPRRVEVFKLAQEKLLDTLPKEVARCYANGYASELTGGIDSRLVYALGLAGGGAPKIDFTIGNQFDNDVIVAELISKLSKSKHIRINNNLMDSQLAEDGYDFVSFSGFSVNAASYSWLPSVYRQLDSVRTGQLTGAGGECACDFYFTPFDRLIKSPYILDEWLKKRLYLSGNKMLKAIPMSDELHKNLFNKLKVIVNTSSIDTWRNSMTSLYSEHRVKNWVGPVLNASDNYYNVSAPLLSDTYLNWANSIPLKLRRNRQAQLGLIKILNPKLAMIPYGFKLGKNVLLNNKHINLLNKIYKRTIGFNKTDDLGSTSTIKKLTSDVVIREELKVIMREYFSVKESNIELIINNPDVYTKQLGYLVTACWAKRKVNEISLSYKIRK